MEDIILTSIDRGLGENDLSQCFAIALPAALDPLKPGPIIQAEPGEVVVAGGSREHSRAALTYGLQVECASCPGIQRAKLDLEVSCPIALSRACRPAVDSHNAIVGGVRGAKPDCAVIEWEAGVGQFDIFELATGVAELIPRYRKRVLHISCGRQDDDSLNAMR